MELPQLLNSFNSLSRVCIHGLQYLTHLLSPSFQCHFVVIVLFVSRVNFCLWVWTWINSTHQSTPSFWSPSVGQGFIFLQQYKIIQSIYPPQPTYTARIIWILYHVQKARKFHNIITRYLCFSFFGQGPSFITGTNVIYPIIIVWWWLVICLHHDVMHWISASLVNTMDTMKVKKIIPLMYIHKRCCITYSNIWQLYSLFTQ